MKKVSGLFLILLLLILCACSNFHKYETKDNCLAMEEKVVIEQLSLVWGELQPKPDSIAGTIEYWKNPAGDDFILYYTNDNKLYYSTINVNNSAVTNHGLVLTEKVLSPMKSTSVLYIDGKIVAKEFQLTHITFKKFISSMDYSFEDVRNDAASGIGKDYLENATSTQTENQIKCSYFSRLIEYELLSSPGTSYARIYDDATITDYCENWYEVRFSAEVYQNMSMLTDKVICYAWIYSIFDFENSQLVDVHYESFSDAPHKYFYITYRLADQGFTDSEIAECRSNINWGVPVSRNTSTEVSLWGTIHSNEYYTDFWLDESVIIQIGEKQYDVSRIEIDDTYLFSTMISGKPIGECDGEHVFLTGTIASASDDFALVKFYTLREGVVGIDTPYSNASDEYEIVISGLVRYNEQTALCDIVLAEPIELTAINGYAAFTEFVRVWPVDYNFANDNILNYAGQKIQVKGIIDYELGVFSVRPTMVTEDLVDEEGPMQSPDSSTINLSDIFVSGTWWDMWSQRCHLTTEVVGYDTVQLTIEWPSGANNTKIWHITGKWDDETHCLYYKDCIMIETEAVDWRDDAVIVGEYTDGTGYFYFNNGYLYWVDYKENAGEYCYFEFYEYLE